MNHYNRFQAFAIHLLISIIVLTLITGSLILWLYPDFYFKINGGWEILFILMAVDLVLGPCLTLVVFNPEKKSLKFDLTVIAVIQIAALLYGSHTLYNERPVFLTFVDGDFYVVTNTEIERDEIAIESLAKDHHGRPKMVFAIKEKNEEKAANLEFGVMLGGKGRHNLGEYYSPAAEHLPEILSQKLDLKKAIELFPEVGEKLKQAANGKIDDYYFFPGYGKTTNLTLMLNEKGEIIKALDIQPNQLKLPQRYLEQMQLKASTSK